MDNQQSYVINQTEKERFSCYTQVIDRVVYRVSVSADYNWICYPTYTQIADSTGGKDQLVTTLSAIWYERAGRRDWLLPKSAIVGFELKKAQELLYLIGGGILGTLGTVSFIKQELNPYLSLLLILLSMLCIYCYQMPRQYLIIQLQKTEIRVLLEADRQESEALRIRLQQWASRRR